MAASKDKPNEKPHLEDVAAYRKRAANAPLVVDAGESRTTIMEAVYWPRDGVHGGTTSHPTIDAAMEGARRTLALGYGRDRGYNRVHIIETTTRIIEVRLEDEQG